MTANVYATQKSGHSVILYNHDCISGMRNDLAEGSVDVVVTSPPYNLGTQYKAYDDSIPRREYLDWMEDWAAAACRVLKVHGSIFLNVAGKPTDPNLPFEVLSRIQTHFRLQNVIHWVKSIAILQEDVGNYPNIAGNIGVGHYRPINSHRYLNGCHEYIFHLTKHGDVKLDRLSIGVEYQDKSNVSRWKSAGNDVRCRGNTWFVPYKTIRNRLKQRPHPATFPAKIPQMCIQLHGVEGITRVLDPFLGIGSSALACVELGVDFVGYEIDPDYFQDACRYVDGYGMEGEQLELLQEDLKSTEVRQ